MSELKLPLEQIAPLATPTSPAHASSPNPSKPKSRALFGSFDAQKLLPQRWMLGHDEHPSTESSALSKSSDHLPQELIDLIIRSLAIEPEDIAWLKVFKRSFDARKKTLLVVYSVDIELKNPSLEAQILARARAELHLQVSPDMRWHPQVKLAQALAPQTPNDPLLMLSCIQSAARERFKTHPTRPVVLGLGPCGLFAALTLAQMGLRPIVIERGKPVRERTQDTWGLWRKSVLNPNSNVQFGEGGAGTFSDGKLYSQIKDPRFLGRRVIEQFILAGAPAEIGFAAHPHIGTFKLVKVVESMREQIMALGGEVRFEQKVVGLESEPLSVLKSDPPPLVGTASRLTALRILDLKTQQTHRLECTHLALALGHSARDTYAWLFKQHVPMQAKAFSVGFRIEHPQSWIDSARWGAHAGHPLLGAADYKLVHHSSNQRSVYSFCMCPGGTVVAATSEPARVVTNGMSQYSRNERNANAALVVGIEPEDFKASPEDIAQAFSAELKDPHLNLKPCDFDFSGPGVHPLSGIVLQRNLEAKAFEMGGSNYKAPAQWVGDFLANRASSQLAAVLPSYKPGITLTNLNPLLPPACTLALQEALPAFGKKIKHFDNPQALLTGVETRTSSVLTILRDDSLQSPGLKGLFPAGEGAGFAGGILSAGVDGIRVAEAMATAMLS
jgi:uncharacterized FAD-dependent dehydrogenase